MRLFPHALRRRGHYAPSLAALVGVVALAAILLGPLAPQAQPLPVASTPSAVQTSGSPLPLLLDGGQLSITSLPQVSLVTDSVQALSSTLGTRSYSVAVHVSLPLPLINLDVRTTPISVWAWPSQMPEGPVALPPLSLWTWTVTSNSRSDTTNWTLAAAGQDLQRTIPVANETFVVTGTASLTVPVTVTPNWYEPYSPPTVGFVLNAAANYGAPMFPANNPEYSQLAAQLRPTVVRIDLTDLNASGSWDTATRLPKFNFTQFDLAFKWAASIHAPVLLTLSAGTWGTGTSCRRECRSTSPCRSRRDRRPGTSRRGRRTRATSARSSTTSSRRTRRWRTGASVTSCRSRTPRSSPRSSECSTSPRRRSTSSTRRG